MDKNRGTIAIVQDSGSILIPDLAADPASPVAATPSVSLGTSMRFPSAGSPIFDTAPVDASSLLMADSIFKLRIF